MRGNSSRKWTKWTIIIVLMCIVVGIVIAYCYVGGMFGPAGTTTKKIRIGCAISLSGKNAETAWHQISAYRLWVDEVNAQGGIYVAEYGRKLPVELVVYDDESDPTRAVALYEKLITQDKVDLIIGPYSSAIAFAVGPIAEKYRMPLLCPTAASDKIYQQGWKYVFDVIQLASTHAKPLIDFMKTKPDIKRVAIVYLHELMPMTFANATKAMCEAAGFQVVLFEEYPKGITDMTPLVSKLKALNPDGVIAGTFFEDNVLLIRTMKEMAFNPKFIFTLVGSDQPEYVEVLGNAAEGILAWVLWHKSLPYPGVKEFYNKFKNTYGKRPNVDSAVGYAACQLLQKAIEIAGSINNEKVWAALRNIDTMTIYGPFKYNDANVNIYSRVYLGQIQHGELEIVWPPEVATAEMWYPKPPFP